MDNKEDELTVSFESLLTAVADLEGGENSLRRLLLLRRRELSSMSIDAGGDITCLDQIDTIDQLLKVLRESIESESPLGNGTVGERSRRDARGMH